MAKKEIIPPWVEYPGFPPGDGFWRQSGQLWLNYVWEPYWQSLDVQEQEAYLHRWNVPEEWRKFYFDAAWREWLESTDEPE